MIHLKNYEVLVCIERNTTNKAPMNILKDKCHQKAVKHTLYIMKTHKVKTINKEQKCRTSRLKAFKITRAYLNDYPPIYPYIKI